MTVIRPLPEGGGFSFVHDWLSCSLSRSDFRESKLVHVSWSCSLSRSDLQKSRLPLAELVYFYNNFGKVDSTTCQSR